MSDNWVVQNLQNALETWNEKLAEIWTLVTQSPQAFKGGSIWNVMVGIHGAVQAVGLALVETNITNWQRRQNANNNFSAIVPYDMEQQRRETKNRITSHDIHALSEDLKQPGFVTITDAMLNRVNRNWAQGRKTHVFIDEFHIAYENEYSGNFFTSAWRQFRKRNAAPCAITQNVEYLLDSILASTMLSNSEFIVMLNQAESDQERLSRLLNISPEQMSYVNGAEAGCGLMRYGNALVPFVNRFPADTELYKLITTKPGEGLFAKGQVDFHA